MNKKIAKLGEKTNLTNEDVKKLTKIGISGLLAVALSVFTFGWSESSAAEVRPLPEKCRMVPEKSDCKGLFTTYYFDSETNTCMESMGCVTSVFDSKEECDKACTGQNAGAPIIRPNGFSKYAAISPRDFERAE